MTNPRILKIGGAHLDDPRFLDKLLARVHELRAIGPVILVHGGGTQISELQEKLGITPRKHEGLRATSREGMTVVAMVLSGLLNKRIVAHFGHGGLSALGVSGPDCGLLRAPFWGIGELGRVGGAPEVDRTALDALLGVTGLLVVAPVCLAPDGGLVNVNADTVAQALAVCIGADVLEFVTDVDAVKARGRFVPRLNPDEARRLISDGVVRGGMRPKIEAALSAIDAGVGRVRVGSLDSLSGQSATSCTEVVP